MKQSILILVILIFSLISWGIWAYGVLNHYDIQKNNTLAQPETPIETVKETSSIQELDLVSLENTINTTVKDVAPSVVSIIIKKDLVIYRSDPWGFFQTPTGTVSRKVGWWSGFFVRKDGTIITNKHVVQDVYAQYTVILNTGEEYNAVVIALDPINDLAIIKITDNDREFRPLELIENLESVEVWDFWIAVGNALAEFQNSVSLWIVSAKNRSIEAGWETLSGLIQTDAAINPGNSGGPLINLSGKVIGINTAIASNSNGIWFAFGLTGERVNYMLQSITDSGRIMRPFIGINYIPNSPWVASELSLSVDYGVYIIDEAQSILEWSSAEKSGLEPGDIILSANDIKLDSSTSLWKIIQNSLPGDILNLNILKKSGKETQVDLELWAY